MGIGAVSGRRPRILKYFGCGGLWVFLLLASGILSAQANEADARSTAAMLANIALFIDWPAQSFFTPGGPMLVCVLGERYLGDELRRNMAVKHIGARSIEIRHSESAASARRCHIVFIDRTEEADLPGILATLNGSAVLTVSDIADFARRGGMVGLVRQGEDLRFELNSTAAGKAGLAFDAGLKRVALTVLGEGE
ncbi:MAG: YfiR family protein [Desulfuromonadales bacterium]